jgi:hypothetical protein
LKTANPFSIYFNVSLLDASNRPDKQLRCPSGEVPGDGLKMGFRGNFHHSFLMGQG